MRYRSGTGRCLITVLEAFDVEPDYDLSIMKEKQTLFDVTINILGKIRDVLEKEKPDVVLVHGDTTTTFTTALACFYMQIPVGRLGGRTLEHTIYIHHILRSLTDRLLA